MKTIKLFVVDDSAVVRQSISKLVEDERGIELLGVASDPIFAMEKFKKVGLPDVLILDVEMPRMNGVDFLKKIMSETPIATIICSSVTKLGSFEAKEIHKAGAFALVEKPNLQTKEFIEQSKENFINVIKSASKAKLKIIKNTDIKIDKSKSKTENKIVNSKKVIAIGSSTGGVQVLEKILTSLVEDTVPIMITQHMPAGFTASLANRLDNICKLNIRQAEDGDELQNSTVYIAQGDKHMFLEKWGLKYIIKIQDGPKVSHHRPSVDILFKSFAKELGSYGVGIILTGMGSDGAKGLKEMFNVGAKTYAQNEDSCVVYGMPNEAVKLGGVTHSLSIGKIIETIQSIR